MPKYDEIAADLRARISRGEFQPGQTLPTYDGLLAQYQVSSRAVLAAALRSLEERGLVCPVKGKGVVVRSVDRPPLVRRTLLVDRDGEQVPEAKTWTTHRTLPWSWQDSPPPVAAALGSPAYRQRQLMGPEGDEPVSVTDTWLPQHGVQASSSDLKSTLRRLAKAGHRLSWRERARSGTADTQAARLLGISRHMPVTTLVQVGVSDSPQQPVVAITHTIPCDRIEIELHP